MTSPLNTVELRRIGLPPRPMPADHPQGQLFYLHDIESIVLVERREPGGWRCRVIARRGRSNPGHTHMTDEEIAAASTTITVDPITDPDGYALLWQAQIWQRWPGGHMPMAGRLLAGDLRTPGTLIVELTPYAVRRLQLQAQLRPPGLRRLLARLIDAGLLGVDRSEGGDRWRAVALRCTLA